MKKNYEKGFSLIEVVVSIFVALLIGIAALSLLNTRATGIEDKTTVQEAETRAEEALSALTAIGSDLPIGGSFGVRNDTKLKITACSEQVCDFVLTPDVPEGNRTSSAKGFSYISHIPSGSQVKFVRRWLVEEVEGNYNLRRITVAILKDEQDTQPIVLEQTIVGINR